MGLNFGNRGQAFIPDSSACLADVQPQLSLPCPNCGAELAFLDQYQRHFCYTCQQYAPEGYGARGGARCPTCGGILSYVALYDRMFCFRCQQYAHLETAPAEPVRVAETTPAAAEIPAAASAATARPAQPSTAEDHGTEGIPSSEPSASTVTVEEADEELVVVERPPLSRELIEGAKKSLLLDLCRAYGLDPSGTKEQLRERLLTYLDEEEASHAAAAEQFVEEAAAEVPFQETEEGASESTEAAASDEPEAGAEPVSAEAALEREVEPEPHAAPARDATVETAVPVVVQGIREAPPSIDTPVRPAFPAAVGADRPCPRCGRELEYIAQYDRWYCYSCRAYAPKRAFRHACPTCGATLRWIERYERWWCDTERRYAPSDLPTAEAATGSAPAPAAAAVAVTPVVQAISVPRTAIETHRHRSPGAGIGVAAFGLFLWLAYELFVAIPAAFATPPAVAIPSDVAFVLQFLGTLLLGGGLLAGLSALRDRR
jgi:hypothetical protein